MISKLEWTQSNAHLNIEQLHNIKMGVTFNSKSTITEPPRTAERTAVKVTGGGGGGLNATAKYQAPTHQLKL